MAKDEKENGTKSELELIGFRFEYELDQFL